MRTRNHLTNWQELANRWHPRCPTCGEKQDVHGTKDVCDNARCPDVGRTAFDIWGRKWGRDDG